jgi:hypothetical protein
MAAKAIYLNDPLVESLLSVLQGRKQGEVLSAAIRLKRIVSCYCNVESEREFPVTVSNEKDS